MDIELREINALVREALYAPSPYERKQVIDIMKGKSREVLLAELEKLKNKRNGAIDSINDLKFQFNVVAGFTMFMNIIDAAICTMSIDNPHPHIPFAITYGILSTIVFNLPAILSTRDYSRGYMKQKDFEIISIENRVRILEEAVGDSAIDN